MSENRCVCCGAVIPEGRQVCKRCEVGTDNNVGSKTADEMFRELGYEKEEPWDDEIISYYSKGEKVRICINTNENAKIVSLYIGKKYGYFEYKELLACAQLIKEMGCVND